jgi:hypothetical protein
MSLYRFYYRDLHNQFADIPIADAEHVAVGPHVLAIAIRPIGGYGFVLYSDGIVRAGCRTLTIGQYRRHAKRYGRIPRGTQTLRILDYFAAVYAAHRRVEATKRRKARAS